MSLPRGSWLGHQHDAVYGTAFKVRMIGGWGGSRKLARLANEAAQPDRDVYQWGVYTGGTMKGIAKRIHGFGRLWGFDSFQGLPAESRDVALEGSHWKPGAFSSADAMHEYQLPALLSRLHATVGYQNMTLVPGYFNASLSAERTRHLPFQPALLVDIDVDLHLSTIQCLTWMIERKLLVPGTLVRYDDFRRIKQRHGEGRAHRELTRRYRITWENLGHKELNSREWRVVAIGDPGWRAPRWL